jgi:hypothetical protein
LRGCAKAAGESGWLRLNPVVWVPHGATTVPPSLGRLTVVDKDRESIHPIAGTEKAQIFYRRSNERPYEYAILLQIKTEKGWQTRVVADNSHVDRNVAEHHWHRYRRGEKQPSQPLPFAVSNTNDAMGKVIEWFAKNWTELISDDDADPR